MDEEKEAILPKATPAEKEIFEKRATLLTEDQAEKETILLFEKWVMEAADQALARDDLRDEDREMLAGCVERFRVGIAELQETGASPAFNLAEAAFVIGIYAPRKTLKELQTERGMLGGTKSGELRQQKADDEWRTPTLKFAQDVCDMGAITQDDLVTKLFEKIKNAKNVRLSRDWLAKSVRKWEQAGLLVRNKPKKRAKK